MDKEYEKLSDMPLHTELSGDDYTILKVPGGLIYTLSRENGVGGYDMSSCFVPFEQIFCSKPRKENKQ